MSRPTLKEAIKGKKQSEYVIFANEREASTWLLDDLLTTQTILNAPMPKKLGSFMTIHEYIIHQHPDYIKIDDGRVVHLPVLPS